MQDVSFGIKKNEIFGLIGPNGAGKSTLIKIITSQLQQDAGEYVVSSAYDSIGDVEDHIIDQKRYLIGYCPQDNVLWEDLTVREHLVFFSMLKGLVGKSIEEEVSKFEQKLQITPIMDKTIKEVSGGQQRKVSLAVAFIAGPKLVILDEPSKSLDPLKRRKFWDLTKSKVF